MLPMPFLLETPGIAGSLLSVFIPVVLLCTGVQQSLPTRTSVQLCPKSFTWSKEIPGNLLTEPKPNMNFPSLPNVGVGAEYEEGLFSLPDEKAYTKINFPP